MIVRVCIYIPESSANNDNDNCTMHLHMASQPVTLLSFVSLHWWNLTVALGGRPDLLS